MYGYAQTHGLSTTYLTDSIIRGVIQQMMALTVGPQQHIPSLCADIEQELADFFRYFNKQWMHQIPMWNVFDIPERTNNFIEGIQKQSILCNQIITYIYDIITDLKDV